MTARQTTQTTNDVQGFARRRLSEALGVALCLLGVFILLSLVSYHEADPSLNRTGTGTIHNAGGVVGAYISDLALQTTGLASALLPLCLIAWGWRLLVKNHLRGWWVRLSMLLVSLCLLSAAVSPIEAPRLWPIGTGFGGSIGFIISFRLGQIITDFGVSVLMFVLSAMAIPLALGLRRKEWVALAAIASMMLRSVSRVFALIRAALRGRAEDVTMEKSPRRPKAITADEEAADEEEAPPKGPRLVEPKTKKKEPAEEQPSFELRQKVGDYHLPSYNLLGKVTAKKKTVRERDEASLSQNAKLLESVLQDFGVNGEVSRVRPGPVVTLYELEPSPGTRSSRVVGLSDDIARSMSTISARIAVIPGRNALGIELPNTTRETVYLRELIEDETFQNTDAKLPLALGKDISGSPVIVDLARMPHLLVAGTTGSGKSVAVNAMILSLLYHLTPEQCRFIMIDPKMLELSVYDNIPHLLAPVVTEPGKAVVALKWTVKEMENRYRLMSNLGVRNIESYNKRIDEARRKNEALFRTVQTGFEPDTGRPITERIPLEMNTIPYIVVVVDEMADLMLVAGKDIETSVQRLAQMARAAGIHIVMATQRPSVDVITGVIKANFPTRISFQVTSKIDSRTVLGEQGAEQLLGQGDMLYMAGGGRITRVHGPFVSDQEVERVVAFLKEQGEPEYDEAVTFDDEGASAAFSETEIGGDEDGLYQQALTIVLSDRKASTSYIQRRLKIGYNRAARLIDRMEEEGVVGPANHVGKREVLRRAANE